MNVPANDTVDGLRRTIAELRQQLDEQDLAVLFQEAQTRGARHIELRQTCLGEYEHGEGEHWRPVLSRLASLVQAGLVLSMVLARVVGGETLQREPPPREMRIAVKPMLDAPLLKKGTQTPAATPPRRT